MRPVVRATAVCTKASAAPALSASGLAGNGVDHLWPLIRLFASIRSKKAAQSLLSRLHPELRHRWLQPRLQVLPELGYQQITGDGRVDGSGQPAGIADAAAAHGCQSVAFTYNDPVIFAEYAWMWPTPATRWHQDSCRDCRLYARQPRRDLRQDGCRQCGSESIRRASSYFKLTGSQPATGAGHAGIYLPMKPMSGEITTLLIPGHKQRFGWELHAMVTGSQNDWGRTCHYISPHFILTTDARHCRHPPVTLTRARNIAAAKPCVTPTPGNVVDREGHHLCPQCNSAPIERDWHQIHAYQLWQSWPVWLRCADSRAFCCQTGVFRPGAGYRYVSAGTLRRGSRSAAQPLRS